MPTSVSSNSNTPPPPGSNHSPSPGIAANKISQQPSLEETTRFNAIFEEPVENPESSASPVPPENSESAQENSELSNQGITESVEANVGQAGVQRNAGQQDNQESSDNVQSNPGRQNNQDNPQKVQGNSNQQNHQGGNQGNSSGGSGSGSGGGGGGHAGGQNSPLTSEQVMAELGMSILSALGAVSAPDIAAEPEPVGDQKTIVTLGQELIDKFYASSTGDKGIYLELKVLDNAKVLLTRDGNLLNIQFDATTDNSANQLLGMKQDLADYMQRRLGLTVDVKVKNLASGDQTGGDGRSRQQRQVVDEYQPGSQA